jgi:hypothetical protein
MLVQRTKCFTCGECGEGSWILVLSKFLSMQNQVTDHKQFLSFQRNIFDLHLIYLLFSLYNYQCNHVIVIDITNTMSKYIQIFTWSFIICSMFCKYMCIIPISLTVPILHICAPICWCWYDDVILINHIWIFGNYHFWQYQMASLWQICYVNIRQLFHPYKDVCL